MERDGAAIKMCVDGSVSAVVVVFSDVVNCMVVGKSKSLRGNNHGGETRIGPA